MWDQGKKKKKVRSAREKKGDIGNKEILSPPHTFGFVHL